MVKFKEGTVVSTSGYKGVVTGVRGKDMRYVRLASGTKCVDVCDLRYYQKSTPGNKSTKRRR